MPDTHFLPALDGASVAATAAPAPAALSPAVDVSILMPCLNERATLPQCLAEAREALDALRDRFGLTGEIVVADNGSTDGSQALAASLGARVVPIVRRGYGAALTGGVQQARGRFLVMGDADASYDFREAVAMVESLMAGAELCMGNRFRGRILDGAMPWKNRYIGNPALTGLLNLLFRSGISDAHCGLRAFTRDAFERLGMTAAGMEFASEMVVKASLLKLRVTEVPITLRPDGRGRAPHLRPWRDGWRHLRFLLMLSPGGLFHVPAAVLGFAGILIFNLLLLHADQQVVRIGPFSMGDHWAILAGGMLAVAHQLWLAGLGTTLYGVRIGYRRLTGSLAAMLRLARLEVMLVAGLLLMLAGAGAFAWISLSWSMNGFGALWRIRELTLATALFAIGLQTVFGGFLVAIMSGNTGDLGGDLREVASKTGAVPSGAAASLAGDAG